MLIVVTVDTIDILEDGLPAYRLKTARYFENEFISAGYTWYRIENDGLYFVAYSFGFSQITYRTPLRFTILHFAHLLRIDGDTFILKFSYFLITAAANF